MNLRHIDPRSTDWMDAMLEGDFQGGKGRHGKREQQATVEPTTLEGESSEMLAAHASPPHETRGSRPPPGR